MVWLPPATAGRGPARVTRSFQVFVEAVPWGPVEETGPIVCPLALMGKSGPLLGTYCIHAMPHFSVHFVGKDTRQREASRAGAWPPHSAHRDPEVPHAL